jgi:VWFA-related protein
MQKGSNTALDSDSGARIFLKVIFATLAVLGLAISFGNISWAQNQQQSQSPQQQSPPPQQSSTPPTAPQSQSQSQQREPPQSKSKISTEVKLVTVYAAVRDKHGKIIPNLNQSDFALQEDARPQTIKYFARESDLPLTLGLLVDTSLSQRRVLDQEKSASYSFFDHILREDKDKAFLIHFDREVELLRDLTASREKLRSGLEELDTPSFTNTSGGGGRGTAGGSGRSHGHGGGGTLLYDSIYLASNELMKKQQGRKALIILTDGVDHGSKESLNTAIAFAQRADTAVYSILFADEDAYGPGGRGGYGGHGGYGGGGRGGPSRYPQQDHPDGKKVLERISKETGGQLFEVKKKLSIEQIYAQIEEELRNQYSLGYTPDRPGDDSTYHLIHVTVTQKDLIVQAREGYYSGP